MAMDASQAQTPQAEVRLGAFQGAACMGRLLGYARGLHGLLALCVVGSLASAAIQIATPLLVRRAVDCYMVPTTSRWLSVEARVAGVYQVALAYAGLLVLNLILGYGVGLGLNHVGQYAVTRVRAHLWAHLHTLPIRFFDTNPVGRLVTRVANDPASLSELFSSVVATGLGDVFLFCGVVGAMTRLDARLAAWMMTLFPLLLALSWWFKVTSQAVHRRLRVILARVNAFFQENVQGVNVVKTFQAAARMRQRFRDLNDEAYRAGMDLVYLFAIFRPLAGAGASISIALALWQGSAMVTGGTLTLGTLLAFLFYVRMLYLPVEDLAEKFNVMQEALVASERLFHILDTPEEMSPSNGCPPGGAPTTPRLRGHVVFDDVHFAYDADKPVLRGVSFEVRPGEKVALVGPTGSGKTTITALLLGFYRIAEGGHGRVLVDGTPLESFDVETLRSQIGLVSQDQFLFNQSLYGNVALFEEQDDGRVQEALAASQAAYLLDDSPLDGSVPRSCCSLSQGERQLLSFARALAIDPPMLILDEATASVDSKTEQAIQEGLRRLLAHRTALIVAHRLSTVQEADRILVLKKGRIVEEGTHTDLLAQNGLYAHLFRTQQLTSPREPV